MQTGWVRISSAAAALGKLRQKARSGLLQAHPERLHAEPLNPVPFAVTIRSHPAPVRTSGGFHWTWGCLGCPGGTPSPAHTSAVPPRRFGCNVCMGTKCVSAPPPAVLASLVAAHLHGHPYHRVSLVGPGTCGIPGPVPVPVPGPRLCLRVPAPAGCKYCQCVGEVERFMAQGQAHES